MKTLALPLLIVAAILLSAIPGLTSAETRTLAVDAGGVRTLRITAEAGDLEVEGVERLAQIEVTAAIDGDERDVRLSLEKDGDRAELISETEDWPIFWFGNWTTVDLKVRVPYGVQLEVDDGSGEIRLRSVASHTRIDDGSGAISIRSHRGNLRIDDGSGSINIAGVNGRIDIDDGSGSIVVQNVIGDVDVDDGSGSLRIKNVDGHVTVRDGSGSIDVDTVKRGLTVLDSGSGGLVTRDIQGGERSR